MSRDREMGVAALASPIPGRLTWSVRVLLKRISDQADPIHFYALDPARSPCSTTQLTR
jgi:hypothetical protein